MPFPATGAPLAAGAPWSPPTCPRAPAPPVAPGPCPLPPAPLCPGSVPGCGMGLAPATASVCGPRSGRGAGSDPGWAVPRRAALGPGCLRWVPVPAGLGQAGAQWQFWHWGWHLCPLTLQRQPPLVSPGPWGGGGRGGQGQGGRPPQGSWGSPAPPPTARGERGVPPAPPAWLTPGPQRGPLVTQQISVWQTVQRIQSQPSFFCTMMRQVGQCMASPICTSVCRGGHTHRGGGEGGGGERPAPPGPPPRPKHLQHGVGLPGGRVVLRLELEVVLVLAAVLPFVDGLGGAGTAPLSTTTAPPQQRRIAGGGGRGGGGGLTLQSRQLRAWQMGQRNSLTESS